MEAEFVPVPPADAFRLAIWRLVMGKFEGNPRWRPLTRSELAAAFSEISDDLEGVFPLVDACRRVSGGLNRLAVAGRRRPETAREWAGIVCCSRAGMRWIDQHGLNGAATHQLLVQADPDRAPGLESIRATAACVEGSLALAFTTATAAVRPRTLSIWHALLVEGETDDDLEQPRTGAIPLRLTVQHLDADPAILENCSTGDVVGIGLAVRAGTFPPLAALAFLVAHPNLGTRTDTGAIVPANTRSNARVKTIRSREFAAKAIADRLRPSATPTTDSCIGALVAAVGEIQVEYDDPNTPAWRISSVIETVRARIPSAEWPPDVIRVLSVSVLVVKDRLARSPFGAGHKWGVPSRPRWVAAEIPVDEPTARIIATVAVLATWAIPRSARIEPARWRACAGGLDTTADALEAAGYRDSARLVRLVSNGAGPVAVWPPTWMPPAAVRVLTTPAEYVAAGRDLWEGGAVFVAATLIGIAGWRGPGVVEETWTGDDLAQLDARLAAGIDAGLVRPHGSRTKSAK